MILRFFMILQCATPWVSESCWLWSTILRICNLDYDDHDHDITVCHTLGHHVDRDQWFWGFLIMLYDDQQSWFCSVPHIESRSCCSFWSKFPLHCPPCTGIQCHQHHCHHHRRHHDHDNYHCRRRMVNIIIHPKHCLVLTYQFFLFRFHYQFLDIYLQSWSCTWWIIYEKKLSTSSCCPSVIICELLYTSSSSCVSIIKD